MISKLRMTLYVPGSWNAGCAALDNHHLEAGESAISSSDNATSLHATSREKNYVHLHTHSAGRRFRDHSTHRRSTEDFLHT